MDTVASASVWPQKQRPKRLQIGVTLPPAQFFGGAFAATLPAKHYFFVI
jgi:hypothetical protein